MNIAIRLFCTCVYCTLIASSYAQTNDPASVLSRLDKSISKVHSLETDFVQEKDFKVFKNKLILHGKVYMKKPDLFAWHLYEPIKFRMVLDGKRMLQWDEESDEVQKVNLGSNPAFQVATQQMSQWFSGNYSSLQSEYDLSILSTKPLVLKFVPMKKSMIRNFIDSVTVTFRQDERYTQSVRIVEKGGDSTLLIFKNTTLNSKINDDAWKVKP